MQEPSDRQPEQSQRVNDNVQNRIKPPDGGYGWVCVLSQFLINAFTWGAVAAFSVYLTYYLSNDLYLEAKPTDYALIGGLNFSLAVLVAPLTTRLTRKYGIKTPMSIGCLFLPGGFFGASFATELWQLYLSQGVAVGLGVGFIYLPSTAVIPQWFARRRSLANGICAAGSGIGGCTLCFATQAMIDSVGYRWSLRITALIVLFANLLALLLLRSRNEIIRPTQRSFDFRLLEKYHVVLLLAWCVTVMFGYITLMFSLADYSTAIGFATQSAIVAAVLNIGAAIGRPMIGHASDRLGVVEVTAVLTFVCGVLCFAMWIPATSLPLLVVFALLSGAILGVFWATIAPLAAEIAGLADLPSCLSLVWLAIVLPTMFAEMIALKIRRPGQANNYLYPQIFAGLSYIIASSFMFELWRSRKARSKRVQPRGSDGENDFRESAVNGMRDGA